MLLSTGWSFLGVGFLASLLGRRIFLGRWVSGTAAVRGSGADEVEDDGGGGLDVRIAEGEGIAMPPAIGARGMEMSQDSQQGRDAGPRPWEPRGRRMMMTTGDESDDERRRRRRRR